MASPFANLGLGMMGSEGNFVKGGPVNDLVKMLPAFGAAYGLVKSGAVDKLNAGSLFSNPKQATSNYLFGNTSPAGSVPAPATGASPAAVPDIDNSGATTAPVNRTYLQSPLPSINATPETTSPSIDDQVQDAIPSFTPIKSSADLTNSGVTSNALDNSSQQANSNSVLQMESSPVAPPNNQQKQSGGGGIGTQVASALLGKLIAPLFGLG